MTTVLMTADAVGGVWTYSLELAQELARHSIRVVLVVMGPPPSPAQRAQLRASPIVDSFELGSSLEWMDDPWRSVDDAGGRLLELEARVQPDLVHLNGYAHGALAWSAPTVVVAHSDVLSWWRAVHGESAPASWQEYSRRVRSGLDAASAVIAPTEAVLQDLRHNYKLARGMVIHNGRSSEWIRARAKEPLILAAGRAWDPAKNVGALDAVASRLAWPVYVAGDEGPADAASPSAVRSLGFLPFDDLVPWLARASIYAAPARYEPFGLAILEAALCRCALVLGDIPSLRELWDGVALFVPPDDHAALHTTLDELTREPERCRELGESASTRAHQYDPAAMAQSYATLYTSLRELQVGVR